MPSGNTVSKAPADPAGNTAAGFTLLEVIVSMVLISMVGMASYALISTNVSNLGHIKDHLDRVQLVRNALAFMEQVNPMEDKSGSSDFGPYKLHWKASLEEPKVWDRDRSYYSVGLYKTHVKINLKAKTIEEFDMLQVGYDRRTK